MKSWSNAIVINICVFLLIGGCHNAKKAEASKPSEQQKQAVTSEQTAPAEPKSLTPAAEPAAAPKTAPALKPAAAAEPNKAVGQQPKIKFESTVYDLNNVKPDSKNMATFKFTNAGKGDLKIIDIQKTCGCTVPELTKRDYLAGESGTIKVEYHAAKIGGPVVKHLYVMSNDPNEPRVEIMLKANIVVPIEAEPKTIQLSLEAADANAPNITITSINKKPFSITRVESTNNTITADIDPNASAEKFVIKPKVDMEKLKSNLNGNIKFNIAKADIDEVTVYYSTLPEFELQPAALIIRSATPMQSERRELWVKSNYNKPFEIDSVSSKNGYIKLLNQEKINNTYKLSLEITPPEQEKIMFFNDTLTINIKNQKPMEIVCRGFFRRSK